MAAASPPLSLDEVGQNKGPVIVGASVAAISVATIFVFARLYVRARILCKFHLDDYLIVFSWLCAWATVGITIAAVDAGMGRHQATLTPSQISQVRLLTLCSFIPGLLSFGVPKLAVVALLTRVLNLSAPRWHNIFLWVLTGLCNAVLCAAGILAFAQCSPPRMQWDLGVKGQCLSPWILIHYSMFSSGFSAFVDLYLTVYPGLVLSQLKISRLNKTALSFALIMGILGSAVAIYKCVRLSDLANPDSTYATGELIIWTM
ncbi:hypothetical protein B0I35DRAFT_483683 [Stachybotrys elegans]|uniref:Rhodopsin domain-containing protein n=1 Tax=Stachybotrys elegans TaxID=80388 RepID=A0A8K0SEK0_9HYPO|nr:hypothetical protein B0I35DRAFT_483683 [Stachybotrys elegans]